jgi:predicted Rossmann-fold nucleotide-binding protein
MGTMEAVSRGAAESGGHVIGVTSDEIESWRPARHNRWVQEEWRFPTLRERLYALIDACDAAIALPGGIGTLAEIAVMWSQMQISPAAPRPLILIGTGWQDVLTTLYENLDVYVSEHSRSLVTFSPDVQAAFALLPIEFSHLSA